MAIALRKMSLASFSSSEQLHSGKTFYDDHTGPLSAFAAQFAISKNALEF
jgi:hypothetical protein